MPCPPPMDAATNTAKTSQGNKKMTTAAATKKKTTSSWIPMGFYHRSSISGRNNRAAQQAAQGRKDNSDNNDKTNTNTSKKKRSSTISRSITCAASICSSKETSVLSRRRDDRGAGRSASSRSLKVPDIIDDVDAVYASAAAAVSATSSFNSEATGATTTVTTTASSSPLSSVLSSPATSFGSSFRGVHQIRKLSGCYECHSVFDPRTLAAAFPCSDCHEVFAKADSLELHKATRHAVSELGREDTSRNIVEIIFQSSWLRKQQTPVCKIDRILKVHNSNTTVKRFEHYKESIKERASGGGGGDEGKKNARCVADGNELLRFHCTTFTCSIGAAGGTALCRSLVTQCKLCAIIRDGFRVDGAGKIATMATSGRAHDMAEAVSDGEKKAMLVCRVVAGRVKKACDTKSSPEECDVDSVSPSSEMVYSDLDELFVFNPRAILPCFVVIYSGY